MLNLLIGEKILPEKHLKSSQLLCEIHNSLDKEARVLYRDGRCHTKLNLQNPTNDCWQQLNKYIEGKSGDDADPNDPFYKVVIHWPCHFFKVICVESTDQL